MTFVAAAWGGGVNSTAMLVEWLRRGKQLDITLFADTGGEKPGVYAFRDIFAEWIKGHTSAPFITVKATVRDESLEAECLRSGTLPSLAYGFKRCSLKWKRQPQDKFLNNYEPSIAAWKRGEKVVKLIGYDAGEERRATIKEDEKYTYRYPLIEWGMDRDDCVAEIAKSGLPKPPKSACFFCPATRPSQVLRLAEEHPDLLQRALEIERNAAANLTSVVGLGRGFSWASLLEADRRQGKFDFAPAVPCDCYDGGDEE